MSPMARSLAEHLRAVEEVCAPLPPGRLAVDASLVGSVLAVPVQAQLAVPPCDNSAVDGYAVRRADLQGSGPWRLPVCGDVPAGASPREVTPGTALRVMTGAELARASDLTVIPVEDTDSPADLSLPAHVTIAALPPRAHVRLRGEHIAAGAQIAAAGDVVDPGLLSTLISCGISHVEVHPRPRVAVLTTGDEVGTVIPNSNGPLACAVLEPHASVSHHHCHDDVAAVSALLDQLAAQADLIVTIGGISAGAYDVVKAAARSVAWFGPVAIQPGKPQGVGRWENTPLVCLPGNPVAAWVGLELFVLPGVARLAGTQAPARVVPFPVEPAVPAREGVAVVSPVAIDWRRGVARLHAGRSHMVGALAGASGLAVTFPDGSTRVQLLA